MAYSKHAMHVGAESFARYINKWKEPCQKCAKYSTDEPLLLRLMSVQECYECTYKFLEEC
jgi:hypothetical protein